LVVIILRLADGVGAFNDKIANKEQEKVLSPRRHLDAAKR